MGDLRDAAEEGILGPVTVTLRVDHQNPGHTWVTVFCGRNEGARGRAGQLVFRTDEWNELLEGQSTRWASANNGLDGIDVLHSRGIPVHDMLRALAGSLLDAVKHMTLPVVGVSQREGSNVGGS